MSDVTFTLSGPQRDQCGTFAVYLSGGEHEQDIFGEGMDLVEASSFRVKFNSSSQFGVEVRIWPSDTVTNNSSRTSSHFHRSRYAPDLGLHMDRCSGPNSI